MEQVRAAAPVAPWLGGKRALHRTLIDRISRIPHKTYVEPFVGMGGVFLRRPFRPRLEVANDRNGEIVNLFRILQRHYAYLMDTMRFHVTAREEFERLRRTDPATLTDLERAARFLYLQRLAFGGQVSGVFGVSPTSSPRFDISRLGPLLEAAHSRLTPSHLRINLLLTVPRQYGIVLPRNHSLPLRRRACCLLRRVNLLRFRPEQRVPGAGFPPTFPAPGTRSFGRGFPTPLPGLGCN
ncbi:DNA adenine methylase [Oceanicella sp. SM1341]|uniref:DNA adenine methylase n=1 Tax=Oceanicella sp. SM1341 TaxID=1548889 RepID=UPI000E4F709A|nr:DNA adenine methylase [Oceanicella sp. SM1341]